MIRGQLFFILTAGLVFMTQPALAADVRALVREAIVRCEGTGRVVKDEMYISQAHLSEKEGCILKQFAMQLVEAEEETIKEGSFRIIEKCVKEAKITDGIDQTNYQKCMMSALTVVANKMAVPCQEIPKYMPTKIGQSYCEQAVLFFLANRVRDVVNPPPPWPKRIYNKIVTKLNPILPLTPLMALAIYMFYLAAIFWRDENRPWQLGIVTTLLLALLVLRFFGFLLGPLFMIIILLPVLVYNFIPRKAEVDLGLHPDQILPKKNDHHNKSQ